MQISQKKKKILLAIATGLLQYQIKNTNTAQCLVVPKGKINWLRVDSLAGWYHSYKHKHTRLLFHFPWRPHREPSSSHASPTFHSVLFTLPLPSSSAAIAVPLPPPPPPSHAASSPASTASPTTSYRPENQPSTAASPSSRTCWSESSPSITPSYRREYLIPLETLWSKPYPPCSDCFPPTNSPSPSPFPSNRSIVFSFLPSLQGIGSTERWILMRDVWCWILICQKISSYFRSYVSLRFWLPSNAVFMLGRVYSGLI